MSQVPQIRHVMTASPRTIDADASVLDAQMSMERSDIRHLPVTNSGKLVGIVSDRDIKFALDPLVGFPPQRKVRGIMTSDIYVVPPSEPLDVVLQAMADRRIGCALVAEDGALLGIFTTTDAARMLADLLRRSGGETRT